MTLEVLRSGRDGVGINKTVKWGDYDNFTIFDWHFFSGSYNRYTALHGILHVQKVSLNIIEAMYIENTKRFAWELRKNGQLHSNNGFGMFVYSSLTAALPEIAPPIELRTCSRAQQHAKTPIRKYQHLHQRVQLYLCAMNSII